MRIENHPFVTNFLNTVQNHCPLAVQKGFDTIFRKLTLVSDYGRSLSSNCIQIGRAHPALSVSFITLAMGIAALALYYFRRSQGPLSRKIELESSKPSTPAAKPNPSPSQPIAPASTLPIAPVTPVAPAPTSAIIELDVRFDEVDPSCPAIFNDRAYEYGLRLTQLNDEKIVVKPTDRHILLVGPKQPDGFSHNGIWHPLPSCLFAGKTDGDTVEFKLDGIPYRLTLRPTFSNKSSQQGRGQYRARGSERDEREGSFQATFEKAIKSSFCRNFKKKDVEGIPKLFGFLLLPKETTVPLLGSPEFNLKFYEDDQEPYQEYKFLEQVDYGALVGPQMQLEDIHIYNVDTHQESYFLLLIPHKLKLKKYGTLYHHGTYMVIGKDPGIKYIQLNIVGNNYLKYHLCDTPPNPIHGTA